MNPLRLLPSFVLAFGIASMCHAATGGITFEGKSGPGMGKKLVFLTGDEEYRSEEGLTQLAKILAERQGFTCTVLFSVNKEGEIDPNTKDNEPGMEALDSADGCVTLLRFREWPDEQMKHFVDYINAGKPIVAMRTSTHAFNYGKDSKSAYAKFSYNSKEWPQGFGKQVLGETWVSHWGSHKKEGTRGIIAPGAQNHPILRGVSDIFVTTDVYEAHPPADATVLLLGQVATGLNPTDPAVTGPNPNPKLAPKNDPMQPIAWTRDWTGPEGKVCKTMTTTMGASVDLLNEGVRRMLVNAVLWEQKLEIPAKTDVTLVGDYQPLMYGFNGGKKGMKPADLGPAAK